MTRFGGIMLGTPTITISFLITLIAVIRWNLWGLIIVPLLVLATTLGGSFADYGQFRAFYRFGSEYDYCGTAVYVSTVVGLLTIGLDVILFKKVGTKKIVKSPIALIVICGVNYLILNVVQFFIFRLMTAHSLFSQAQIIYTGVNGDFNLAIWGESGLAKNLFGLAIAVIGILILRSQGVITNVVDKLVDDKINAELDAKDRNFRIEEVEEKEAEEIDSNAENEAKDESNDDSSQKQF
ncbi:MAG: hypothetical protein J6W64_11175 [Bacilli bacterium]|nr:hypothetical protein [Bacilli bacterium]